MPGQSLKESDLCDAFNASRTPVRDAVMRLSESSLVDILPYKDNRVSYINMKNLKQLIYARAAVEERMIRDFASQDNDLLLEDMFHAIRRQEIIVTQKNFEPFEFFDVDREFHRIWYKATNNEAIYDFFHFHPDYTRLRILDMRIGKDYEVLIQEHIEIARMIKKKDYDNIYNHILKHLMGCYNRTLEKEGIQPSGFLHF